MRNLSGKVCHARTGSLWAQKLWCMGCEADSCTHAIPFNTHLTSLLHWPLDLCFHCDVGFALSHGHSQFGGSGVAHGWFSAGQHRTPPPPQLPWACSWPCSFSLQCETSLEGEPGLCWCVYPWSGKRILGSVAVRGDPQCQQYFNLQNWKQMQYDWIPAHEIFKYIVYLYSEIHTHFYIERCICIYM